MKTITAFLSIFVFTLISSVSFAGGVANCKTDEIDWSYYNISPERRIEVFNTDGRGVTLTEVMGAIVLAEGSKTEMQTFFLCGAIQSAYYLEGDIREWASQVGKEVTSFMHNDESEATLKIKTLRRDSVSATVQIEMDVRDADYGDFQSKVFAKIPLR